MSDNIGNAIRWAQSARRHRTGKASARWVMMTVEPTPTETHGGARALLWIGNDERGRELEITAVEVLQEDGDRYLLVIHVMSTHLKG